MNINFKPGEFTPREDASIDITLGQMKANTSSQAFHRLADLAQQVDAARAALFGCGVDVAAVKSWLALHSRRLGAMTPTAELHNLRAMEVLRQQYGSAALNAGLRRVVDRHDAEKASMPYLRAVLASIGGAPEPRPDAAPVSASAATPAEAWARVCARLAAELSADDYRTWIEPVDAAPDATRQHARLAVPDDVFANVVNARYADRIRRYWQDATGADSVRLTFAYA